MTFWKSVPLIVRMKGLHIRKISGRLFSGFHRDYGDVPAGRLNEITGKFEECVNPRGYAYALRKALRYRAQKIIVYN